MKKNKRRKYPLEIKQLPPTVKKAWFYGGKDSSVHIIFNPTIEKIKFSNEAYILFNYTPEQLDLKIQ